MTDAETVLCVSVSVGVADGYAERRHGVTPRVLAHDGGYAAREFLIEVESRRVTWHSAMAKGQIKGDSAAHYARRKMRRRQRSKTYRASRRLRHLIEPVVGWCKDVGGLRRTRYIGHERIRDDAMLVATAWNPLRMTRLRAATWRPFVSC